MSNEYNFNDERDLLKETERREKRLKLMRLVYLLLVGLLSVGGALVLYSLLRSDFSLGTRWSGAWGAVLVGAISSICLAILTFRRSLGDEDQTQRSFMADFEQFEKNVKRDIFRTLQKQQLDKFAPKGLVLSEVQKRVDDALVSTIDEALQRRLTDGARSVDVIAYIDDIQARVLIALEGPAGRAESRSTGLMWGAILVGTIGLVIAVVRVFSLGDYSENLLLLNKQLGSRSVWPYVFALSTPWVTLVALVEFSALILLKLSNQFSLLQRQYTELLVEENARFLALKAIVRFGEADQIVAASNLFIRNKQPDESKDETMQESISAISKLTENLAGIVKQFAGKDGKPAG